MSEQTQQDELDQPDQQAPHEQQEKLEQEEADERSSPSGRIVYKAVLKEGEEELARPSAALFWSGLAAGLSMGFSMISEGLLRSHLPDSDWRPLLAKLGYTVGFLIVILGRQQLFTENTLTPILPLLKRRNISTLLNVLRLWGVVLVANLLGALAVGSALADTQALDLSTRQAFLDIGHEAMAHGFGVVLWRGVFAGWLLALMVWLLPFAETGRVAVIIIITYLVGLGQFSHSIAGSVETFALAAAGEKPWLTVLGGFLVPTLIGNILGGVTLVAAINHAQVVAGETGE